MYIYSSVYERVIFDNFKLLLFEYIICDKDCVYVIIKGWESFRVVDFEKEDNSFFFGLKNFGFKCCVVLKMFYFFFWILEKSIVR